MKHCCTSALLAGTAFMAQAHEGHGLPGTSHWHAGDTWLWLGVAAVGLVAWLIARQR